MGVYDTLVDGEDSVQVKCLGSLRGEIYPAMRTYNVGDRVVSPEATMTIIVPDYPTGRKYALIKDGRFIGITRTDGVTFGPYFDKWGKFLAVPSDFRNIMQDLVDDFVGEIENEEVKSSER